MQKNTVPRKVRLASTQCHVEGCDRIVYNETDWVCKQHYEFKRKYGAYEIILNIECLHCGVMFTTTRGPGRGQGRLPKYCCEEHWKAAIPAQRSKRYAEKRGVRTRECGNPECTRIFELENKQGQPRQYCDPKCRNRATMLRNAESIAAYKKRTAEERRRKERERYARIKETGGEEYEAVLARGRRHVGKSQNRARKAMREALRRGSTSADFVTYEELFERDGGECVYCRRKLTIATASMDHVVPCAKGGSHTLSNLALCCFKCNVRKCNLDVDVFLASMQ